MSYWEESKLRILSMGRKGKMNDSLPGSLDMLILKTLTPAGRRARIYTLTPSGRKQLTHETKRYKELTLAIASVMGME